MAPARVRRKERGTEREREKGATSDETVENIATFSRKAIA